MQETLVQFLGQEDPGEGIGYPLQYFWSFLVAQLVKNSPVMQETPVQDPSSGVRKIPWRRNRLPTPVFSGFPGGSDGRESSCNVGDLGLIPGLERSPGGGHGNPLQYSGLENPHGPEETGRLQSMEFSRPEYWSG